jgi:hypothetical protein
MTFQEKINYFKILDDVEERFQDRNIVLQFLIYFLLWVGIHLSIGFGAASAILSQVLLFQIFGVFGIVSWFTWLAYSFKIDRYRVHVQDGAKKC